jgi:hypothetical protein
MTVANFSGYATKAGLKCTDGRTIMPDAFKHMDGITVPLVWQHGHKDPKNVLGHAVLEARSDGVYAYGYFNDTEQGKNAQALVEHDDIKALSIYANKLVERGKQVFHGMIRELSLCLAGANPGAFIDNVVIAHSDGETETLEDEAIIYTGLPLEHEDRKTETTVEHATVKEVYDTMTDEQKDLLNFMVGQAMDAAGSAAHSDDKPDDKKNEENNADDNDGEDKSGKTADEGDLNHKEGSEMTRNVFETAGKSGDDKHVLSHDDMKSIVEDAADRGSMKAAVEAYALKHGIENIEVLFPEARSLTSTPEWNKRRTEWVAGVLGGTRKSPFSRVKSVVADITMESARALGYIKGNLKKEEWFSVSKRTTTPTTVYKKQKLDRDDIIDITDFDVVAWMKGEMRLMLEEELARAILIGDGRDPGDEDKIKDPVGAGDGAGIRSILHDHELYVGKVYVNIDDANSDMIEVMDAIIAAREGYKGTGTPTLYTTEKYITKFLLTRDNLKRRLWRNLSELADELRVAAIVPVEVMETEADLVGILVNLQDYNIGADKGGEVNLFDDFDIDYNQYKYLIETRISGALVKIKSAQVILKTAGANVLVAPNAPDFDGTEVTITDQTGVVYKNADTSATMNAAGSPYAVASGATLNVAATPAAGYYFATSENDEWSFTNDA